MAKASSQRAQEAKSRRQSTGEMARLSFQARRLSSSPVQMRKAQMPSEKTAVEKRPNAKVKGQLSRLNKAACKRRIGSRGVLATSRAIAHATPQNHRTGVVRHTRRESISWSQDARSTSHTVEGRPGPARHYSASRAPSLRRRVDRLKLESTSFASPSVP